MKEKKSVINKLEQLNLFSELDTNSIQNDLDVVKMSYLNVETLTWKELFSGFNELHAITYSSGINFAYQLIKLFDKAEIIFGCEHVISYQFNEIMAFQTTLIKSLQNSEKKYNIGLTKRISDSSLKLYVAKEKLSHEKIYLLKANDGRTRVIMGSANMSYSAFNGKQRENICYLDDKEAYDYYLSVFERLKDLSVDNIGEKAVTISDIAEDAEELPIAQTIKTKKVLIIDEKPTEEAKQNIIFALDVKNLAAQYKSIIPKNDKDGKIRITPEQFKVIKRRMVDTRDKEKEERKEYPHLHVSVENQSVSLNGEELNLKPSKEEISKDVNLFLQYMKGFERFHGDIKTIQKRYYAFANWFFVSPFMAIMRETANAFSKQIMPYPVFGLVYGQSKGGKTSFLVTLLKMMIGQKIKIQAPEFTRSTIEGLRRVVEGSPIIVDDLTNDRFTQHAVETIKNDDFGLSSHLLNYPAVVISANTDVKAVAQEIMRRTVICRVQIGLTNTEVMKSNVVRRVQKDIGTAFYREYLRRMLEIVPNLISQLKDENIETSPDILASSSKVIIEIIKENINEELPDYIRELNLEDYFGDKITGEQVIENIKAAWKNNRKAFRINKKQNQLCYNAGETYEAERMIKELPETLEPRRTSKIVIVRLDEAKKYFSTNFHKGFLL